jgi:hypothetical protein
LNFIFNLTGYTTHFLPFFFTIKKIMARVTNCLASTIYLNFSSLFHSLNWRAATLRRQAAYEVLAISLELATGQPFPVFTARCLIRPLPMRASSWNFGEVDSPGTCGLTVPLTDYTPVSEVSKTGFSKEINSVPCTITPEPTPC